MLSFGYNENIYCLESKPYLPRPPNIDVTGAMSLAILWFFWSSVSRNLMMFIGTSGDKSTLMLCLVSLLNIAYNLVCVL